jgi:hypothetical protein
LVRGPVDVGRTHASNDQKIVVDGGDDNRVHRGKTSTMEDRRICLQICSVRASSSWDWHAARKAGSAQFWRRRRCSSISVVARSFATESRMACKTALRSIMANGR